MVTLLPAVMDDTKLQEATSGDIKVAKYIAVIIVIIKSFVTLQRNRFF